MAGGMEKSQSDQTMIPPLAAAIPSRRAEARPRLSIRRSRYRLGRSFCISSTTCQVPSGESSSTTMISVFGGVYFRTSWMRGPMLSRSL